VIRGAVALIHSRESFDIGVIDRSTVDAARTPRYEDLQPTPFNSGVGRRKAKSS
jgi:hypothetical protein